MSLYVKEIKTNLINAIFECSQRGLLHSTKWFSELNYSLKSTKSSEIPYPGDLNTSELTENSDIYLVAKSYFDLKEYDRAAYFLIKSETPKAKFLYFYSLYLSEEKKKIDNMIDIPPDPMKNEGLKVLCNELRNEYSMGNLDGFCLYIYGVVLKKLKLLKEATEVLTESIHKQPMHWGSWLELASLIEDKEKLQALLLPNHWMRKFFLGHMYLEFQLIEQALSVYCDLQSIGFQKNVYILAQIATGVHYNRDIDGAMTIFKEIRKDDPYCLDNMDTYSNLLYVKELKNELSHLAHIATEIDKYRLETCCIVGNYYSMRGDHEKAVNYFYRALKINPQYLSAWTLLGHEFMEMKNTNGAIHSYRQAIEVNRRDYRAWYGLGQTYEILKMPFYGLYYYKQAQVLKPFDSRMLLALGEAYEKQGRYAEALKCFYKACHVGDIEGMALIRVAQLHEKLGYQDYAAAAYSDFVADEYNNSQTSEMSEAYKYLTEYHLKLNDLDLANYYAQKCLTYDDTKEEAKALLRTIARKRINTDDNPMLLDMNETPPVTHDQEMNTTQGSESSAMNLSFNPE